MTFTVYHIVFAPKYRRKVGQEFYAGEQGGKEFEIWKMKQEEMK